MNNLLVVVAAFIFIAGCDVKKPESAIFLPQDLDLSSISRVAVLPFGYASGGKFNAQRVQNMFITELMASNKFEVVDKGTVDATLRQMAINTGKPLTGSVLKILAKKLEVDAFLSGTVNKVEGRSWGPPPYPEISLTLNLIDAESAKVIWRSTAYRNAYSDNQMFNLDPKVKYEVTRKLLQDMIGSIPK